MVLVKIQSTNKKSQVDITGFCLSAFLAFCFFLFLKIKSLSKNRTQLLDAFLWYMTKRTTFVNCFLAATFFPREPDIETLFHYAIFF